MNPERWRRIEEVYLHAADLSGEARRAYLDGACAGDAELRGLVERMLASGGEAGLEPPSGGRLVAALRMLATDLQGTHLGDFVLQEEIGRGGMGVVYRARQENLARDVAVKVLPPPLYDDEVAVERFRRESLAASRLRHPGIVPVLAAGREHGLFYYAMELVDGWSLRHLLQVRERTAPDVADPRVCAALMRDVALALAHSHAQGVLHRDVKPQNILIERRTGAPRLIDFGLAKVLDLGTLSRTGDAAGTPLYMSPEQVRAKAIDERTDIYSLGAVLYELLTGSPPFPGRNSHEIMLEITQGLLRPVRARQPGVQRDLAAICEKALEREPSARYRTAEELAADLSRYLAGETVAARPRHLRRRAQHALTRRRLLQALPAVALAAAGIGYVESGRRARAAERARLPVVRVRLRGAAGAVNAYLLAPAVACDAWLPRKHLGRFSGERFELRVPAGEGRLVLVDELDAFAEVRRAFAFGAPYDVDALLAPSSELEQGMRRIEGGVASVALPPRFEGGSREMRREDAAYGAFLIDVRPVTRADYRRYLELTRGFPDPLWDDRERARWDRPPHADWYDLPMTRLSPVQAMAYAEWAGKRLPTWTEWNAAVFVDGLAWLTEEQRDPTRSPFNFGKEDRVDFETYLKQVAAVPADAALFGPHRLAQPLGNVLEMLESFAGPHQRILKRGAWHSPAEEAVGEGALYPAFTHDNDASYDRGFRCAKSLQPFP